MKEDKSVPDFLLRLPSFDNRKVSLQQFGFESGRRKQTGFEFGVSATKSSSNNLNATAGFASPKSNAMRYTEDTSHKKTLEQEPPLYLFPRDNESRLGRTGLSSLLGSGAQNKLRTIVSPKAPTSRDSKPIHSRDTILENKLTNTMYSHMQDFSNRLELQGSEVFEESDPALVLLMTGIQTKLDLLITSRSLKLDDSLADEKEAVKSLREQFKAFRHSRIDGSFKSKILTRNELRITMQDIGKSLSDIENKGSLRLEHFTFLKELVGHFDKILEDFKQICVVRTQSLSVSCKMIFSVLEALIERLLGFADRTEKNIWQNSSKISSVIEQQIKQIASQLRESKQREDEWRHRVEMSKKESIYLAKMVKTITSHNLATQGQMKKLEFEKAILSNELANSKFELLQKPNPNMMLKVSTPSKRQQTTDPASAVDYSSHSRWIKLKENIDEQYNINPQSGNNFEKDMNYLIKTGLEKVKLHNVHLEEHIKEIATDTKSLIDTHERTTQTTVKLVENVSKTITADVETQIVFLDVIKSVETPEVLPDHKNKMSTRYSLQYQLRECFALKEVVDNFLLSTTSGKHPRLPELLQILVEQSGYTVVHKDLANRIVDSLESIDSWKLKLNAIGETLNNLKEENKKLKTNNYEYENQNHDLTKKIDSMRDQIDLLEKARLDGAKFDWRALDSINKNELAELISEYAHEIKTKLLELALSGASTLKPQPSFDMLDPQSTPPERRSNRIMKLRTQGSRRASTLTDQFDKVIKPFVDYDFTEPDRISVDDDEEINLVNEEATPCTILITKMLNLIKSCLSTSMAPLKAMTKEQARLHATTDESIRGIKSIAQIIKLKKIAKQIRLTVLQHNPNFKIAYNIVANCTNKKNLEPSMPSSSVLKLISDIYLNILLEVKLQDDEKAKLPMSLFAYNYIQTLYPIQKMAENKFRGFVETILAMVASYDSSSGHDRLEFSTKILLFSKFLALRDRWDADFMHTFFNMIGKFEHVIDMVNSNEPSTEVGFDQLSEIMLSPELCRLNLENRNNLTHFLDTTKYLRSDDRHMQYKIKFEPAMLHYRFLWKQQSSLVGSLLNDIYLIRTSEDQLDEEQYLECWEFLMIIEHLEPGIYQRDQFHNIFFEHADLSSDDKQTQVMSVTRFAKLCLMNNYLSKKSQNHYFKHHKINNTFNFDSFCVKFRSDYMDKISSTFFKIEYAEIDEKKLIDKINYAIAHRHYFSMKGLQSTFAMLSNKANQAYRDFYVKNLLLPDEYYPIISYTERMNYLPKNNGQNSPQLNATRQLLPLPGGSQSQTLLLKY